MTWSRELESEISEQVLTDNAARDAVATDFGRIVVRRPATVVRPVSGDDVARVVRFAARHGLAVSTRGGGHSQTGQSLSQDIVLDLTSLDQVRKIDEAAQTVVAGAGVKWRALVERLLPSGLSPPVLTNNLDVTVGGTLSTAGLGVASWRYGTQADRCVELEVVTGAGEIIRCSAAESRELFDAVRGGVGQFGVVTEAKIELRRHRRGFRSFYLLYDDLAVLLDDLKTIMVDERFDYLEAWCAPCAQGFKKVSGQRQPFAEWFFPLHATIETDAEPGGIEDSTGRLKGLKFYKHVHTEVGGIGEFFARLDSLFALWKRGGFWEMAHPWMECILPWQSTAFYVNQVLQNMPPQAVVGGHILLWPARGNLCSAPLFMRPASELVMGFGILPAVPRPFVEEALPRLNMASQAATMVGGKRYLSGWIAYDHNQWKGHYGDHWEMVVALKKKFDPQGVLNPGFIQYA